QLHNRIESALLAKYGPIETWDEDHGIGLSDGQYKSLAATMAEWFMDWIKDEGMVRTPGTVEISREDLEWARRVIDSYRKSGFGSLTRRPSMVRIVAALA